MGIPRALADALRPVTVIVGHYGAGKTNFACNLAIDLREEGHEVTLIDLDIVNPYFRASEQRAVLEAHGVDLIAPVFAEAGSSLDVPSLRGSIAPAIESAGVGRVTIIDAGGDDVGATALGRYAQAVNTRNHALLYVANRYRNLVQDPCDALENLREIEGASHIAATAIANNSHLKGATTLETVLKGVEYAREIARLAGLPLVCTTMPPDLVDSSNVQDLYPIDIIVKSPWE